MSEKLDKGLYIIATGGGTGVISSILEGGGASSYFVGAEVPYAHHELLRVLNNEVWGKPNSARVASQLAMEAFKRASAASDNPIGIGITCSLCKITGERDGRENSYHIHVVHLNDEKTAIETLEESFYFRGYQYERNRLFQEQSVIHEARLMINSVLDGNEPVGKDYQSNYLSLGQGEGLTESDFAKPSVSTVPILCGSFNPFHAGHKELVQASITQFNLTPIIEVAMNHKFKAGISSYEYYIRHQQIRKLTTSHIVPGFYPGYMEKNAFYQSVFPDKEIVFIVGADVYEKVEPECRDAVKFMVVARNGVKPDEHPNQVKHDIVVTSTQSSTALRASISQI